MNADTYLPLPGRAVIALSGDDARPFLQGLVTNDIDRVAPDRAIYAALLTPKGKFLHDFFIAEMEGRLLLDVDGARIDDLMKRLRMYRLRAKVEIADESADWQVFALLPGVGEAGTASPWLNGVAFADPRHAALGGRAILPAGADPADAGLRLADATNYEMRRLSLAIPGARDLVPEKSMPLECGFDELDGVSFTKGCFVGQEVTTRMKHRNLVKRRLFTVEFDGTIDAGTPVTCGDVAAGEIRTSGDGVGIALLRLDLAEKEGLTAGGVAVRTRKPEWAAF